MKKNIWKLFNHFKLKKILKEFEHLNNSYISIVDWNWKNQGYSKEVSCWEKSSEYKTEFKSVVSFLQGLDLVLHNPETDKKVYLMYLPSTVDSLVKKYFELNGTSISGIELFKLN